MFLTVIDNYYTRPNEVREFAFSCEFARPFTGTWNGLHSLQRPPDAKLVFHEIAGHMPSPGRPNWKEIEETERFWDRPSAGIFALLLEGQTDTVHFHHRTGTWAGVIYLFPGRQDAVGTCFYRHLDTGKLSSIGASPEELATFRADATNPTGWELISQVQMRYNRLVMFDGRHFHAASAGFGNTPETGRLTQLFSIDFL